MSSSQPEEKLVLAFEAGSTSEAEIIRAVLEQDGVFAAVSDRNNPLPGIDLNPFDPASGFVGCDVYVRAEDLERAREIIQSSREAAESFPDETKDSDSDSDSDSDGAAGDDASE